MEGLDDRSISFTLPRSFDAEGARVGLVTCETCGAALLIDPVDDFNVIDRHASWHRLLEDRYRSLSRHSHGTGWA